MDDPGLNILLTSHQPILSKTAGDNGSSKVGVGETVKGWVAFGSQEIPSDSFEGRAVFFFGEIEKQAH